MIRANEPLPEKLAPIWVEALITSEFEGDTLPLLFSPQEEFDQYYDDLLASNQEMAPAIKEIKYRNMEAREERADGHWPECLQALERAVAMRHITFPEGHDSHNDYTLAVYHLLFSLMTFGTWFLKESGEQQDPQARDAYEVRAFEVLCKAKGVLESVTDRQHQMFFKALLFNNLANYYWRRRKSSAASQAVVDAYRAWVKSKQTKYGYYFSVHHASALLVMCRYEHSLKAMQHALTILPDNGPVAGTTSGDPVGESNVVVNFQPQLMSSALPLLAASCIAAYHNMSLGMVGVRKYRDAAIWCSKCMDVAAAHRAYLRVNHPWIKSIKRLQEYCTKMSFTPNFQKFRMKPSESRSREFQTLQKIIAEARNPKETQGQQDDGGEEEAVDSAEAPMTPHEPKAPTPSAQYAPKPPSNAASQGHVAPRRPKEPQNRALTFLPNIPSKGKPLAALKVYAGQLSHRRIVEDFTNKRNIRPKARAQGESQNVAESHEEPAAAEVPEVDTPKEAAIEVAAEPEAA